MSTHRETKLDHGKRTLPRAKVPGEDGAEPRHLETPTPRCSSGYSQAAGGQLSAVKASMQIPKFAMVDAAGF